MKNADVDGGDAKLRSGRSTVVGDGSRGAYYRMLWKLQFATSCAVQVPPTLASVNDPLPEQPIPPGLCFQNSGLIKLSGDGWAAPVNTDNIKRDAKTQVPLFAALVVSPHMFSCYQAAPPPRSFFCIR